MMKLTQPQITLHRRALLMGAASIILMPRTACAADPLVAHVISPRILGNSDAPIKVLELFSMTCSHCASFHNNTFPDVKKRLIDTGMVQFEMQPFPLDQIALRAHALARALPQSKYFPMVSMLLKDIGKWATDPDPLAALSQMARLAGMGAEKFEAIMSNQPLLEALVAMRQNAYKAWKVQSTPSFVVNDKTLLSGDLSYEDFASKINATDT
ncbi:DsbA family protein [Candidatus Puniceispirillum sp.]|nr:DsbA family protein [Candidatus Puniceispirillum sp.]